MDISAIPVATLSLLVAACAHAGSLETDRRLVWQTVETRHTTWASGDQDAYLATHHADYARWHRHEPHLELLANVPAFWARVHEVEESVSIEVIPDRLQFLADRRVAIAHYTVEEIVEYRKDTQRGPRSFAQGQRVTYRIRFSDVYERQGNRWLYVGGHRDGASLPNRGEISVPEETD